VVKDTNAKMPAARSKSPIPQEESVIEDENEEAGGYEEEQFEDNYEEDFDDN
jgi:hypothetical protein